MQVGLALASRELRTYAHGITVARHLNQGYSLHPSGGDDVWDAWCDALDDLFPEDNVNFDGPHMHPGIPMWYVTYICVPD